MKSVIDVIKERRSIRKYDTREVPGDVVNNLLETLRWTPSWANTQCWEVIWVKDKESKEKLAEASYKGNPANKAIGDAPVLLALCAKLNTSGFYKGEVTTKFGDWFMFDLGLATQTLCLSAQSIGLGTVVIGLFNHDKAKEILAVPEGYEIVALIPLGYPAQTPSAPKRKEVSDFLHYNTF